MTENKGLTRRLSISLLIAVVYFLTAKFSLRLAVVNASASPIWPPTGLSIAAFILSGYGIWPGIFAGAFFANFTTAGTALTSLGIAAGNTLEGLTAAYLINTFAHGRNVLDRPFNVFRFAVIAAVASPIISATVGVASLLAGNLVSGADLTKVWLTWWLGDAGGALIVAPVIILWLNNPRVRWPRQKYLEASVLFVFLMAAGLIVFGPLFPSETKYYPLEFICMALVVWAAMRFSPREMATANLCLSAIAIAGTLHGFGPFVRQSPNTSFLLLQGFMGANAFMGLAIAAVVAERNQTSRDLRAQSETLIENENRFRHLADAMPQIVWTAGPDGVANYFNKRWYDVTSLPESAAHDPNNKLLIHPDDQERASGRWKEAVETGEAYEYESRFKIRETGQYRWFLTRALPIQDDSGNIIQWFGTCTDIDDQKHAVEKTRLLNEELEQKVEERTTELTELNKELEAFSYSVSHDLRAPLRTFQGFAQILLNEHAAGLNEEGKYLLTMMRERSEQMSQLIEDLLHFSRVTRQQMHKQSLDMAAMAKSVAQELSQADAGRHVKVEVHSLDPIQGDVTMMRQVFINLISNAFKFTRNQANPVLEIGSRHEGSHITYFVRDNGAGFDMKYAHKLFNVFQRLHSNKEFEGTGIGLALVQRIIHKHGGRVWAEGKPDAGAVFYFSLPDEQTAGAERVLAAKTL